MDPNFKISITPPCSLTTKKVFLSDIGGKKSKTILIFTQAEETSFPILVCANLAKLSHFWPRMSLMFTLKLKKVIPVFFLNFLLGGIGDGCACATMDQKKKSSKLSFCFET